MTKTCSKCKAEKALSEFHRDKRKTDGRVTSCKQCATARALSWQQKNRGEYLKRLRRWRAENPYKYAAGIERWRRANWGRYKVMSRSIHARWKKRNPATAASYQSAYNKRLRRSTPGWVLKSPMMAKIREFYFNCPEGHHVDHIVPLKGNNVSGLHVIDNLQYLPATANMAKGNTFDFAEYRRRYLGPRETDHRDSGDTKGAARSLEAA